MADAVLCTSRFHKIFCFQVTDLVKNEEGKLIGAKMKDHITGQEWTTKAKSIINATGPFTDAIRKMDNQVSFSLIFM